MWGLLHCTSEGGISIIGNRYEHVRLVAAPIYVVTCLREDYLIIA